MLPPAEPEYRLCTLIRQLSLSNSGWSGKIEDGGKTVIGNHITESLGRNIWNLQRIKGEHEKVLETIQYAEKKGWQITAGPAIEALVALEQSMAGWGLGDQGYSYDALLGMAQNAQRELLDQLPAEQLVEVMREVIAIREVSYQHLRV